MITYKNKKNRIKTKFDSNRELTEIIKSKCLESKILSLCGSAYSW